MNEINYTNRMNSLYKQWANNNRVPLILEYDLIIDYISVSTFYVKLKDLPESDLKVLLEKYPTIGPIWRIAINKVIDKFGEHSVLISPKFLGIKNTTEVRNYFEQVMDEIINNIIQWDPDVSPNLQNI